MQKCTALFICLKGGTAVAITKSIFKDPLKIKVTVDMTELEAALAKAENAAFMALAMMSLK